MRNTFIASIALLLSMTISGVAQTRLTIVADEWPPFSGKELPNGGISLDVISTILERAGYSVTTDVLPWARIVDGAKDGKFDVVGSLFYDAAMATSMMYADPFFKTQIKFAKKKASKIDVQTAESIRPYSIAVGDGFLYEENFDSDKTLNKVVVSTTLQALQMVSVDRVDITLDSEEVLKYSTKIVDPSLADKIEILPFVLEEHDIHMAVRNDLPGKEQLIEDFNRVLGEMRADGSLDILLSKHVVE